MPNLTANDRLGTRVGGRYEIRRLLGEGGFSSVFEAIHTFTGREVALKILHPHLTSTEQIAERFLMEARAMARINHEGIVQVLDAGKDPDGSVFIALELLDGESLESTLLRVGRLTWGEAVSICVDVLSALGEAHRNKIIHRDIKPGNIFIVRKADGSSQAKLLDFGIAHVASSGKNKLTAQGMILGTPEYMSPEQGRTSNVGPESDLWSVGIVMWECLTGHTPFVAETATEILLKIATTDAPSILDEVPELPPPIAAVIDRSLARDIERRYRSADEMRDAMLRAMRKVDETSAAASRSMLRGNTPKLGVPPVRRKVSAPESAQPSPRLEGPARRPPGASTPNNHAPRVPAVTAVMPVSEQDGPARTARAPDPPVLDPSGVPARAVAAVVEVVLDPRRVSGDRRVERPQSDPRAGTSPPKRLTPVTQPMLRDPAEDASSPPQPTESRISAPMAPSAEPPPKPPALRTPVPPKTPSPLPPLVTETRPLHRDFRDSGKGLTDTGKGLTDTGKGLTDTGKGLTDTGKGLTDTGKGLTDTGKGLTDSGERHLNPGLSFGERESRTFSGRGTFQKPPDIRTPSWSLLGAGGLALGLVGAGVWILSRSNTPAQPQRAPTDVLLRDVAPSPSDAAPELPEVRELNLVSSNDVPLPQGLTGMDNTAEFARHTAVSSHAGLTQRMIATCVPGEGGAALFLHPLTPGSLRGSSRGLVACNGFDLGLLPDMTNDGSDDVIAVAARRDRLVVIDSRTMAPHRTIESEAVRGIAVGTHIVVRGEPVVLVFAEPSGPTGPTELRAISAMSSRVLWRVRGSEPLIRVGHPSELGLAVGADADGDGVSDVVAGLGPSVAASTPDQRCVQVFSGVDGHALWAQPYCTIVSRGAQSVSLGPDVNGDGRGEVAVGTDHPGLNELPVLLLSGADGRLLRRFSAPAGPLSSGFGWPVTLSGDMNGNATPDLVVGSVGEVTGLTVFDTSTGQVIGRLTLGGVGPGNLRLLSVPPFVRGRPWSLVVANPADGIHVYESQSPEEPL
jgi:serine/threonine-protein kinase